MAETLFYDKADDLPQLKDVKDRREPRKVLLCTPEYFDVIDVKNPYMDPDRYLDKKKAEQQWLDLKKVYERLKDEGMIEEVCVIEGQPGREDMVFTANQSFPWEAEDGNKIVVMSNMRHPSRQKEVPFFEDFYVKQGYRAYHLPSEYSFEGMGDAIPHPGKRIIYGGHGFRTQKAVYTHLAQLLQTPVIPLHLTHAHFYHLDTCFLPATRDALLLCETAFDVESLALVRQMFQKTYSIPEEEAIGYFALNAHCISDQTGSRRVAIMQRGATDTPQILQELGYEIIEVETSEFIKSGGSVFCMKMMFY